ncbi:MAG TPA: hypothetical protein VNN09_05330 [Candidatus Competibacteraceae bacterium]|nr:hypothetical protein [Candidatus Competibacteraceae bacterium]
MAENLISAEIEPAPQQANQAALALQQLGFRILHIGITISVQGPEALWTATFNVTFETTRHDRLPGVEGGEIEYRRARTEHLRIPPPLQPLITGVMFVEPPQLY